jgi:hypothetical protein
LRTKKIPKAWLKIIKIDVSSLYMLITILYSLWIAYTVFSLGALLGFFGLAYWAAWDNARHQKKILERLKNGDEDPFSLNQHTETK